MARGLSPYLMANNDQDPAMLNPWDVALIGQTSKVVPDEQVAEIAKAQAAQQMAQAAPPPQQYMMQVPENALRQGAYNRYEEITKDAVNQQRQGVEALDRYIREFAQKPTQTDFTALAGWADSLRPGGGNTLEVAKQMKPLTQEAKDQKLLALQDELQKRRGDYAKGLLGIMESKQKAAEASKNERFLQGQDLRMFNSARKEQSGLVKEATDFRGSYRNVEDAIQPDANGTVSAARVSMALSQFARLMGEKGVLTDNDIGRQLAPSLELIQAKWKNILTSNPNARVSAESVSEITAALGAAQKAFTESYKLKADTFAETYFDNPGSPYAGKEWAPKLIEGLYQPLNLIGGKKGAQDVMEYDDGTGMKKYKRQGDEWVEVKE